MIIAAMSAFHCRRCRGLISDIKRKVQLFSRKWPLVQKDHMHDPHTETRARLSWSPLSNTIVPLPRHYLSRELAFPHEDTTTQASYRTEYNDQL